MNNKQQSAEDAKLTEASTLKYPYSKELEGDKHYPLHKALIEARRGYYIEGVKSQAAKEYWQSQQVEKETVDVEFQKYELNCECDSSQYCVGKMHKSKLGEYYLCKDVNSHLQPAKERWIRVEDELPLKDGLYIVTRVHSKASEVADFSVGFGFSNYNGYRVSHWQPFPTVSTEFKNTTKKA